MHFRGLIFIILFNNSLCFFPRNDKRDGDARTKTHADITLTGCRTAISNYIYENKGFNSIDDFFHSDNDGEHLMHLNCVLLKTYVGHTQDDEQTKAYMHCNAEEIELAHNFVRSCKVKLLSLISDFELLRQQLGQCIYTVQSFYSNSNWVEMFGPVAYNDFGVNPLMDIATKEEDTCKDIDETKSDCRNNLLVTSKLTSGYFAGRGNYKPAKPLGSKTGKCSHGGPYDSSRSSIARCGINKESMNKDWSPHHHLHYDAYDAAVDATVKFLVANGTGIVDLIGKETFDKLFHVRARKNKSLALAIDYTSSMTDDIAQVKQNVTNLLYSTIGSANEPADYVLSLFHDPESWNKAYRLSNGTEMLQKVSEIRTIQGDNKDCPELAAAGILAAIQLSRNESTVLVFTDADAKDEDRMNEVITAAQLKNISITSFLKSQCGIKRSVRLGRRKRNTLSFFEKLAQATGGKVIHTDKTSLGKALSKVLTELFPSNEVVLNSFRWSSQLNKDQIIYIDSTVTVLKIQVEGATDLSNLDVLYSDNTVEHFNSRTAMRMMTDNGDLVMSLQRPPTGIIKLRRNVPMNWAINVTAQSRLKIDIDILKLDNSGKYVASIGNPITGKQYLISITVYNLDENGTCDAVYLVANDRSSVKYDIFSQTRSTKDVTCISQVNMPINVFQVLITGSDNKGFNFSRKCPTKYKPTTVEIKFVAPRGEVVLNKWFPVQFLLTNIGSAPEELVSELTSTHAAFIQPPYLFRVTLNGGQMDNGTFMIRPVIPSVVFSLTLSVKRHVSGDIVHLLKRKLVVTDVERPSCDISNKSGSCEVSSLNTANCSAYRWTAEALVKFSGVQLGTISSTGDSSVILSHKNITGLLNGPLQVLIKGTCCTPYLYVSVVDVDGYIAQCQLQFANGERIRSVDEINVSVQINENTVSVTTLIAITCFLTVIISVALLGIMYRLKVLNKKNKIFICIDTKPDAVKPTYFRRECSEMRHF